MRHGAPVRLRWRGRELLLSRKSFVKQTALPYPASLVYDWHLRPGAFERLSPPWESIRISRREEPLREGSILAFEVRIGPIWQTWVAEHRRFIPGREFTDVQVRGPFSSWEHRHVVVPTGENSCMLEDRIVYAVPGGHWGNRLAGGFVHRQLERMFAYRHAVTAHDLAVETCLRGSRRMRVAVSGASGLVGSALLPALVRAGHQPVRLVRREQAGSEAVIPWNPEAGFVDAPGFHGVEAVVHLAGEGIATGRWTPRKKARIRDSRVQGTRLLCETLAQLPQPPQTFLCASAVGFYGDRGEELLDETSSGGTGFLAEVCRAWEFATAPLRDRGVRVVNLRLGVILSHQGGALAKMLLPFKLGLGGVIGQGTQYLSWIVLDDVVGSILHILGENSLSGPINLTAPQPVTNREFTKTLGKVLCRPTPFPMPAFAARLAFGEMADEMLLGGCRVRPARLQASGYPFQFSTLEPALRSLLGKPGH